MKYSENGDDNLEGIIIYSNIGFEGFGVPGSGK